MAITATSRGWALLGAVCLHLCLALGTEGDPIRPEEECAVAAAAAIAPTTVVVQLQPVPFEVKNDTFAWEPGSTQRVVLRVLANDKGTGLSIQALKGISSVKGSLSVPQTKRVIVYRVPRYSGATYADKFAYEVSDINDPTPRTAYVTVNVGPSGILPANGAKPDAYVIRGSAGQTLSQTLDVLNNDVGGQLSIIDATPLPDIATLKGSVQINADKKSITYTLNQYNGVPFVEAFRYKVRDATLDLGAVGAITSARVDISVGNLDQPLAAANDRYKLTLREGSTGNTWELPVLGNDKGIGLFVDSVEGKSSPFKGLLIIPTGGQTIIYTLAFPFGYDASELSESFRYVVKNSTGATAKATVQISLGPEKLVANPDAWNFKLTAQGNLAPTILDVFANDTGSINSANLTSYGPPSGKLVWNDTQSYYVFSVTGYRSPSFSFDIDYTIADAQGNKDSTTAVVSVDASAVKLPPLLANDTFAAEVPPDITLSYALAVLDNDWPSETLKVTAVQNISTPKGRAEVDTVKNWVTYVLPTRWLAVGTKFIDSFRYSAVNGSAPTLYSAEVKVPITIISR